MKKLFFTLLTISAIFSFTACGSDDPEPVIDYTLHDKSELLGTHNGKIEVSVSPGNFIAHIEAASIMLSSSNDNKNTLFILTPVTYGAQINASNFKKSPDGKSYTFNLDNYTIGTKIAGEIPAYIKEWHNKYDISKIILKDFTCKDGATYDKATKMTNFTYSGILEVYSLNKSGVEEKVISQDCTLKFTDLKKAN